jgi:hypothetical protein
VSSSRSELRQFGEHPVTPNPHFETARSWKAARAMLTFQPLEPGYTAGLDLEFLRIHVRDHKMRVVRTDDRTLEAHYGGFVLSQVRKGAEEARKWVMSVTYGRVTKESDVAGRPAKVCEVGPEPPPDDIDGRTPAVVTWADKELFFLVASDTMPAAELICVAVSLYGSQLRHHAPRANRFRSGRK